MCVRGDIYRLDSRWRIWNVAYLGGTLAKVRLSVRRVKSQ